MNKLRIAVVGAIMVVAGLGYAGTANASPVAQRGQTWAVVPEGQTWGAVLEATTPCGAVNAPFWCGVTVPHYHHWWKFGLASITPGEQAIAMPR